VRQVEFTIRGRIDERWSAWMDGLTIRRPQEGETVLAGPLPAPAALYGLIARLHDLGLSAASIGCVDVSPG
jgi:hypothetical protein